MALIGENQVRNILIFKDYPNHATMAEARNAANGDGFVLEADGTAPAAGQDFIVGVKNSKGGITQYKITPSRVTYGVSTKGVGSSLPEYTVSIPASPTAGELYSILINLKGFGSLSVEDEYLKGGYYKVKTGDTPEDVADGLVKSLYRNFSREEPTSNKTAEITLVSGTAKVPQNKYFDFDKNTTDGTAEVATLTVDAIATEDGNIKLTLNGEDFYVPITSGGTTTTLAAEIDAWINANAPDHTSSPAANVLTITSKYEREETNLAVDDNGVAGFAATPATTTPGVYGSVFQIVIKEKNEWFEDYYVTGKKTRLGLVYSVDADFGDDSVTVTNSVVGVDGKGTGYQVRNMEEYLVGNRQDTFRGAGYPHNFPESYDSELDANYNIIDIEYYDEGRDDAQIRSKKQLTICVKEAVGTVTKTNLVKDDLNTAINGANGVTVNTLA